MSTLVTVARTIVYGIVAAVVLLVGVYLIYAFGAGYFGDFAVPTPLNFVVAPALFVGLVIMVFRFIGRRI